MLRIVSIECLDCGESVERSGYAQKRCVQCAKVRRLKKNRDYNRKHRSDPVHARNIYLKNRRWRLSGKDEWNRKQSEYRRNLYRTDPDYRARKIGAALSMYRLRRSAMTTFLRWLRGPDCSWCGESLPDTDRYVEIDHRVPKALWPSYMPSGSVHALSNLQLLHAKCNTQKSARIQTVDNRAKVR